MSDYIQVVTTTGSPVQAQEIARTLVERRLAACVQVAGPIRSTYRWKGRLETEEEWQCTIKTRSALFSAVESAIRAVHSYEVPEIVAVPVIAGSAGYLRWLDGELAGETL